MDSQPLYRKIFMDLLKGIRTGEYQPGARVPSEMELAEMYHVSRITSKKALEMLSDGGYVMRKPGKGTFVLEFDPKMDREESGELEEEKPKAAPSMPLIGVIMDGFGTRFSCELLQGLEYECQRRGMLMMFRLTYGSVEAETQALHDMIKAGAAGIILMCTQNESFNVEVLKLYTDGFPLVLIDREMKGIPIPVVTTDNYKASCELTQKLIDAGHTKIGFLSHSGLLTSTVNERFEGFKDTMMANHLLTNESMWLRDLNAFLPSDEEDYTIDQVSETDQKLTQFFDDHPEITAYFIMESVLAMRVYRLLFRRGEKKDLAFFDGREEELDPIPVFNHVLQGQYQMGVTAVRLLAHRMRGEKIVERVNIPYRLIEGDAAWPK